VLLVPPGLAPAGVPPEELPAAAPWGDRVQVATSARPRHPTVLVRPDGYVAWATDQTHPGRLDDQIRGALTRWCGTPAGPPSPKLTG
jgi:hypothetical protein